MPASESCARVGSVAASLRRMKRSSSTGPPSVDGAPVGPAERATSAVPLPPTPGSSGSNPSISRSGAAGAGSVAKVAVDGEVRVALDEPGRKESANDNPVLAILALEVASDFVKLREPITVGVGYEQLDLREFLLDLAGDPPAQLVQSLAGPGGDRDGVGMAHPQLSPIVLSQQIDLVHHQQAWLGAGSHLLQDRVHRGDRAGAQRLGLGAVHP